VSFFDCFAVRQSGNPIIPCDVSRTLRFVFECEPEKESNLSRAMETLASPDSFTESFSWAVTYQLCVYDDDDIIIIIIIFFFFF
jgi:hypothetical protein